MKLYNFLSLKKEVFRPFKGKVVGFYACGPTVYARPHLGNLRTFIFEDILNRALSQNGYIVKQIMNITDIDDKIIKLAAEKNKKISEITEPLAKIFFKDIKKLNVKKAAAYPKAAKHIKEIVRLVEKLLKNGFAYKGADGSIYFNVSKFKNYGRLSRLEKRKIKIGARISSDEYGKEEARDFALWKISKPGEPLWKASFGNGRPGWHIECSAMSMKYLGPTLDIHAGGVDLMFPHHENEIAQSEAATNKKFSRFFIYGEHLLINGRKMSKSLGNFYTLNDIEMKNFSPLAFRYLVLTSHYRSKLNFTWESLASAQNALDNLTYNLQPTTENRKSKTKNDKKTRKYEKEFFSAINDDLNTPKALAVVWKIVKDGEFSNSAKKRLILNFDKILGLGIAKIKPLKIPREIKDLAFKREKLRVNKQFIQADALRKKMEKLGYSVEDTAYGPKIAPARH